MNLRLVLPWASALAFGIVLACSSSSSTPSNTDYAGSCRELASRCHPIQTPLGHECHELGHDGDDAKCGPRKNDCLAECPERDGGDHSPTDSGNDHPTDAASDGAAEAGVNPCEAYCACMSATCASEPNYPFADEVACLSACAGFSADDRACFADHCEDAKTAADKEHDCEHASGAVACH